MANEWINIRLGDVCSKIGSGATPRGGSDVYIDNGEIALIRSQNVYNDGFHHDGLAYITANHALELENVEVMPDDVLLNITGDSVARCCQVDKSILPARVNQHVAIIRSDRDKLDPRFLRYFLISQDMQASMLSWAGAGATRNALTKGMIESFEILAPEDIGVQRAIAHILGTLDDKIELNRKMNQTLEAMARAIFNSWFVDFDPVHAKAEGRDPGLPPDLAALFSDSFEDSELGEIPKGWRIYSVSDFAEVTSGKRPAERFDKPSESASVPLWGGNGPMAYVTKPLFLQPLLLTGRVGTLGSVFRIATPCWPSDNTLVLLVNKPITYEYLFLQLKRIDFDAFNRGSTQPLLTQTDLKAQKFVSPSAALLQRFHDVVNNLFSKIDELHKGAQTVAALRDALLPKLLSGEIKVKGRD